MTAFGFSFFIGRPFAFPSKYPHLDNKFKLTYYEEDFFYHYYNFLCN